MGSRAEHSIHASYYRNQGLAGRLVEWGTREPDKLGLEAYVEGSYLGRRVFVMHIAEMDFENASPGKGFAGECCGYYVEACWWEVHERRDGSSLGRQTKRRLVRGADSLELGCGSP